MSDQKEKKEHLKFLSLLPITLEALMELDKEPHDDSIVHHLYDHISKYITLPSEAEDAGLFRFVEKVLSSPADVITSVLVLAIRIVASFAMFKSSLDHHQTVLFLLQRIHTCLVLQDDSVQTACFTTLVTATSNQSYFPSCLEYVKSALLTLQTAESMFLMRAAEDFLVSVFDAVFPSLTSAAQIMSSMLSVVWSEVAAFFNCTAMQSDKSEGLYSVNGLLSRVDSCPECVVRVMKRVSSHRPFGEWITSQDAAMSNLMQTACLHHNASVRTDAMQSVINILKWMSLNEKDIFICNEIVPQLKTLLCQGNIINATTNAGFIVRLCDHLTDCESWPVLLSLHQLPYSIVFKELPVDDNLVGLVLSCSTALSSKATFAKLIPELLYYVQKVLLMVIHDVASLPSQGSFDTIFLKLCDEVKATKPPHVLELWLMHYHQVISAVQNVFLTLCCHDRCAGDEMMVDAAITFIDILVLRLVDLNWEVRDTTLTVIDKLLSALPTSGDWLRNIVTGRRLFNVAWGCLTDKESHPRASVIAMIQSLYAVSCWWWDAFLHDANLTEVLVVDEMIGILLNDAQIYPRRAAISFLRSLLQQRHPVSSQHDMSPIERKTLTAVTAAIEDCDWEVKLACLECWDHMSASMFSTDCCGSVPQAETLFDSKRVSKGDYLDRLRTYGLEKTLVIAVEDVEPVVKGKALRIVVTLIQQFSVEGNDIVSNSKKKENVLETVTLRSPDKQFILDTHTSRTEDSSVHQFLLKLASFNPVDQLFDLDKGSGEYEQHPSSLLEDVIAAAKNAHMANNACLMSEDEFDDDTDMFLDCY